MITEGFWLLAFATDEVTGNDDDELAWRDSPSGSSSGTDVSNSSSGTETTSAQVVKKASRQQQFFSVLLSHGDLTI